MIFLTPVIRRVGFAVCGLWFTIGFFVNAFSQGGENSSLRFKAQMGEINSLGKLQDPAIPWIIGAVCIALFAIMLITLWPSEKDSELYQRQRKFARVDGLFFKLNTFVITGEEGKEFLKSSRNLGGKLNEIDLPVHRLTLLSLSLGGASLLVEAPLKKGDAVLLQLHSLPDFPAKQLTIASKVVWVRMKKDSKHDFEVVGLKFVAASEKESAESLKQYLNYLMDGPVA